MSNCSIESKQQGVLFNKLLNRSQNNVDKAAQYLATIVTEDFKSWYKTVADREVNLTDMRTISESLIRSLDLYLGFKNFTVDSFKQRYTDSVDTAFSYDVERRNHAIDILATMFLKGENALKESKIPVDGKLIKEEMLFRLANHLASSTGIDLTDSSDENLDRIDGFNPMFTDMADIKANLKDSKLTEDQIDFNLTLLSNLYANDQYNDDSLFSMVVRHPRVNQLSKEFGLFKDINNEEGNIIEDNEDNDADVKEVYEALRADWSMLSDQNPDISKKVSKTVKELFELTPTGTRVDGVNNTVELDTNTYSGMPESISFNDYYKTIMAHADFTNMNTFVSSLYELATRFPNRSSLKLIADKLSSNDLKAFNLASKIYTQFNQFHVKRERLVYGVNNISVGTANRTSFARLVMMDRAINAFDNLIEASAAIQNNTVTLQSIRDGISVVRNITTTDEKQAQTAIFRDRILEVFNSFNLSIDSSGIDNFIAFNSGDTINNISTLTDLATEINKAVIDCIPLAITNKKAIDEWYAIQRKPSDKKTKNGAVAVVLSKFTPFGVINDDLSKADKAKCETLISNYRANETIINRIRNKVANKIPTVFEDYQLINFEYNSMNVEGNLVADIIKPSYLKRFFERLENPDATLQYFIKYAESSNYTNCNIFVEQRDAKGKIIVPGLLRPVKDTNGVIRGYELTNYYKFLDISLYDGAKNDVLGNNKTYSKMTKTEWDIIGLNEYRNDNGTHYESGMPIGKYFIQTPSDAPKTFIMNSYKLSADGLFRGDKVNTNHPLFIATRNILLKEANKAANAAYKLFETETVDGAVMFVYDNDNRKLGERANIKVKAKYATNVQKSDAALFYHYNKDRVLDKNGNPTGNVFKIVNLNIGAEDSCMQIEADGVKFLDLLYGGNSSQSTVILKDGTGVKVDFNANQLAAIDEYVSSYITTMRDNSIKEYAPYVEYVEGYSEVNLDEYNQFVTEFALNYTVQYDNMNEMFFGDSKMYKNYMDTIKRNKEGIAGGLIYSSYDINDDPTEKDKVLTTVTIGDKTIKVTPSFRYITFEEITKPLSNIQDLHKQLVAAGTPANMIEDILGRFGKPDADGNVSMTNSADAQSWITLDELVRRVTLMGEYELYADTFEALYDESKPVDYNKLSKLIQVQKNFYYETRFDEPNDSMLPIQIKNAEYVLIPRFLGNTELGLLAKYMNDNGIGQANMFTTEKATTNHKLKFWNTDGTLSNDTVAQFERDLKVDEYKKVGYYSNMYKQQDVPQHMDADNKAGIQIIKKMLDNISEFPHGKELIYDFFSLYGTNIKSSFTELSERLGCKYSKGDISYKNGKVEFSNKAFYDLIKDELTRRGVDTNMLSYVELDKDGDPLIPLDIPTVKSKLESVVQAIFTNNITRQTIPGFHASQVTTLGMRALSTDRHKTVTYSKAEASGYNVGRELRYHPDGKNYIEVVLPYHMKKLYTTFNENGEKSGEYTIKDLEEAGLDMMIGYRIPTEGKQSVIVMKVVGFLDPSQGSTIVVPDGFVTQSGADFDIDSVYGMYHNLYVNKYGKLVKTKYTKETDDKSTFARYVGYVSSKLGSKTINKTREESRLDDDEKAAIINKLKDVLKVKYLDEDAMQGVYASYSAEYKDNFEEAIFYLVERNDLMSYDSFRELPVAEQNTREARDNELVDTFLRIMALPEAAEENLMSSNFDDIKNTKRDIFGKIDNFKSTYTFAGQSRYRSANMDGAQLKAISVKRDTFCSICNVSKAVIDSANGGFKFGYNVESEQEVAKFVKLYGEENVAYDKLNNKVYVNHTRLGWSGNGNRNLDDKLITVYSSETTALILDGVKEGGVPNVNMYTFDVYKSIVDAGASYRASILFINQPAVVKCTEVNNSNANIFSTNNSSEIPTVRKELLKELAGKLGLKFGDKDTTPMLLNLINKKVGFEVVGSNRIMDLDTMAKYVGKTELTVEDLIYQLGVLDTFQHYKSIANQINKHSNVFNTDKVGAGQSIEDSYELINKIDNILEYNSDASESSIILRSDSYKDTLLNAIYPRVSFNNLTDILNDRSDSVYRPLYDQLKFGVIAPNEITSNLFKTQQPAIRRHLMSLNSRDLNTRKKFINYLTSTGLNNATAIVTNTYVTNNVSGFPNYNIDLSVSNFDNRSRIAGYSDTGISTFDFTDYSEDNIKRFMELSPARKVALLQSSTNGDNLFKQLRVSLNDNRSVNSGINSKQTISILDSTMNQELLYKSFKEAYYNNNPFIQLAAIDIVRYAVVVEGFNFFGGSVSKIVPTEILHLPFTGENNNSGKSRGLGIINDLDLYYENPTEPNIDNFYQANTDSKDILKFINRSANKIRFGSDGVAVLQYEHAASVGITKISDDKVGDSVRYCMTNPSVLKEHKTKVNLYKVVDTGACIYLYPINKFDKNEIGTTTVNPANRQFASSDLYDNMIRTLSYEVDVTSFDGITNLDKSFHKINRDYVYVAHMNDAYVDAIADYAKYTKGHHIIDLRTDSEPVYNYTGRTTIIVPNKKIDNLPAILNAMESNGYTNYTVVSDSPSNSIHTTISNLNKKELEAKRKERIDNMLQANNSVIRTTDADGNETGTYKQFKKQINDSYARSPRKESSYTYLSSDAISKLAFTPNTHVSIVDGNTTYVVTYLGRVDRKNLKLLPDYNEVSKADAAIGILTYKNRDYLKKVVDEGLMLNKFINLIKIEPIEHFGHDEVLNSVLSDNDESLQRYLSEIVVNTKRVGEVTYDEVVRDTNRAFTNMGITKNNTSVFTDSVRSLALANVANYIEARALYFKSKADNFPIDANGNTMSITNPDFFTLVREDDNLMLEYLKFTRNLSQFIADCEVNGKMELYNIQDAINKGASESELDDLRKMNSYINSIKAKTIKVESLANTVKNSYKSFIDVVLSKYSNNPLIKEGIQKLSDVLEDTSWFQSKVGNIESSNVPLVNVVIKEIISKLDVAAYNAKQQQRKFRNEIEEIIEEERKRGNSISYNDILDEDGRLILDYDSSFLEDKGDLKNEMTIAAIEDPDGKQGAIYRAAERKFNEFMLNNVEQRYMKEYYKEKMKLDKILSKYPDAHTKLIKLEAQKREILSTMVDNDLTTLSRENKRKLNNIEDDIVGLRSSYDDLGNMKPDMLACKAVDTYLVARGQFYKKYHDFKSKPEFETKLKQMLEQSNYPEDTEEYREAKAWIDANTITKLDEEFSVKLNAAFTTLKENSMDTNSILRGYSRNKWDRNGVLDGTKFTPAQVDMIRQEQFNKFNRGNTTPIAKLMRAGDKDVIYAKEFYDNISSNNVPNSVVSEAIVEANTILKKYWNESFNAFDTAKMSISELATLRELYSVIEGGVLMLDTNGNIIVSYGTTNKNAEQAKFIRDEVEFSYSSEFEVQKSIAESKGTKYYEEWLKTNTNLVHSVEYYETINNIARECHNFLLDKADKHNIIRSVRMLAALKDNPTAIELLGDKLTNQLDLLVNKSYNDKGKRTLNEMLDGTDYSMNVLKDIIDSTVTDTSDSLSGQLALLKGKINIVYSREYLANLDNLSTDLASRIKDEWFLDNHTVNDRGEIVPLPELMEVEVVGDETKVEPNRFLYGVMNAKYPDKWMDFEKMDAKAFIDANVEFVNTQYYIDTYREMKSKGDTIFNEWYEANHLYNPYSNKFEPLRIWQKMNVLDQSKVNIEAKGTWTESSVKEDYVNPNFVEDKVTVTNPKYRNAKYDNMNPSVRKMYDLTVNYFDKNVKDRKSRNYLKYGNFPSLATKPDKKGAKKFWDETVRGLGWYDHDNKSESLLNMNQRYVNMPTLHPLSTTKLTIPRKQGVDESNSDYANYLRSVQAENKVLRKTIKEEEKSANDSEAINRMTAFIDALNKHNASVEINNLGPLVSNYLKDSTFQHRNSKGELLANKLLSTVTGSQVVQTDERGQSNISKQFDEFLLKAIYNEYEVDAGVKSKVSRVARSMVTNRMMMMNITSGIANVMYGSGQVAMELAAGTHFSKADLAKASIEYNKGIASYFKDAYNETSTSEVNAIIRMIDILDTTNVNELYGEDVGVIRRLTDIGYMPNSMGEHFMQNTVMLAMLNSHRILTVDGVSRIVNYEEFVQGLREEVLLEVLEDYDTANGTHYKSEYTRAKERISLSDISKDALVRYKKDFLTEYLRKKPTALQKAFGIRESIKSLNAKKEFNLLADVRSQLEMKDGLGKIKDDSPLTIEELMRFKHSVISVNHHIHGVYDKLGANSLQRNWMGALLMQFHKHIVPGYQKRFGYRLGHTDGIYSESRRTVNKGAYVSLWNFVTTPFNKGFDFNSEEELVAIENTQCMFKSAANLFSDYKLTYNTLPEYEKANMRRCMAEVGIMAGALLLGCLGKILIDEDDEDTQVADYILYTSDRLFKEAVQYTPTGMITEAQTLYKNPVAFGAFAQDAMTVTGIVAEYIYTGDKEALIYQSGTYYGENKLSIVFQKNVPVWNQILKHERLGRNNEYNKNR